MNLSVVYGSVDGSSEEELDSVVDSVVSGSSVVAVVSVSSVSVCVTMVDPLDSVEDGEDVVPPLTAPPEQVIGKSEGQLGSLGWKHALV